MKAYQVKLCLKKQGFKPNTIVGVVIAKSQASAISVAMQKVKKEIIESGQLVEVKLVSANPLGTGFLYVEEEEKNKNVISTKTKKKNE
jgi:hypothetical protein